MKYAPKAFLCYAANNHLDQYFQLKGLLTNLEIASLEETKIEPALLIVAQPPKGNPGSYRPRLSACPPRAG
jgi:hypothetical protein